MGRILLLAIITGMVTGQALADSEGPRARSPLWDLYPADLLQSVTRYVASHVEFSGNSSQNNDKATGASI